MDDSARNDLVEALRAVLAAEGSSGKHVEAKVSAARQLGALLGAEVETPDGGEALLSVRERVALRDALVWNFAPYMWDLEQRRVLLKLAVYSRAELDAEVEATRPRRKRAR